MMICKIFVYLIVATANVCYLENKTDELPTPATKQIMQKKVLIMVMCTDVDDALLKPQDNHDLEKPPVRLF